MPGRYDMETNLNSLSKDNAAHIPQRMHLQQPDATEVDINELAGAFSARISRQARLEQEECGTPMDENVSILEKLSLLNC